MKNTFSVLFYVKKQQKKSGLLPIMGRTTVNITGDASCCIIVSNQESKKEQRRAKKVQP